MKLGDVTRLLVLSDDGASSPTGACKELARDDPPKLFRALCFLEAIVISPSKTSHAHSNHSQSRRSRWR